MKKITKALLEVNHLEALLEIKSIVHQFHPLVKMVIAFLLLISVLTTDNLFALFVYSLIIIAIIKTAKLSLKMLLKKTMVGLPVSLCIGLSNLLFVREPISIYGLILTTGLLLMIAIILKTTLALLIVFTLLATTGFEAITSELVYLKVPGIFVLQLTMTYRYIFLLVEEASLMFQAYQLRNPHQKGIELKDMGSFLGNLLVRSFHRCQEIYQCMEIRGFNVNTSYVSYQKLELEHYFMLLIAFGLFLIIKVVGL